MVLSDIHGIFPDDSAAYAAPALMIQGAEVPELIDETTEAFTFGDETFDFLLQPIRTTQSEYVAEHYLNPPDVTDEEKAPGWLANQLLLADHKHFDEQRLRRFLRPVQSDPVKAIRTVKFLCFLSKFLTF